MIGIVDYNVGNLQSVINAFNKLNIHVKLESDAQNLHVYDKLILPGVGAFGDAMQSLKQTNMIESLREYVKSGKYILGICLGMQLLFEKSYEFGEYDGLKFLSGEVVGFDRTKMSFKVPHMGWNQLHVNKKNVLFKNMDDVFYLYFVHSFHVKTLNTYASGVTNYGYEFVSAVEYENILGIQPHPEKSHANGLKILQNFANL